MTVQRAFEAAIWAMPAVSVYDIELSIQRDLGGKFGDVAYFSKPMTSRHGFLTANDVPPYVVGALSCKSDLVIEVPVSDRISVRYASDTMRKRPTRSPRIARLGQSIVPVELTEPTK